ncbi:MAG: hypothetical protein NXI30_00145 [bacterium]|nr:hypothetical protein [bacterium]
MQHTRPDRSLTVFALALGLVAALTGCATKNAAWVHENLEHTENFHAGTSVLETPPFDTAKPHRATLRATARARGRRVGADIELAVRAQLDDYSFLDRVSFSTSSQRAFPIQVVKREPVDCGTTDRSLCDVYEYVTIKLSRDFLKSKKNTGFHAKFWGRRDSVVIHVPPDYIEGLLARMENRPPVSPTSQPVPAAPAP